METTTQPILCCIGGAVAGNPTQFVVERLLAIAGLDWRVITVQVEEVEFPRALAGIQAMRFCAIHFLPPYHIAAASAMFPAEGLVQFVGAMSSAKLTDSRWVGWHSEGFAIRNLAEKRMDWTNTACILVGDSIRTRSVLAAAADHPPATIYWILPEAKSAKTIPPTVEGRLKFLQQFPIQSITDFSSIQLSMADAIQSVLVIGDDPKQLSVVHANLDHLALPTYWVVDSRTAAKDLGTLQRGAFIGDSECNMAAIAFDFEQWTGHSPDLEQLRDAYEEYCDF